MPIDRFVRGHVFFLSTAHSMWLATWRVYVGLTWYLSSCLEYKAYRRIDRRTKAHVHRECQESCRLPFTPANRIFPTTESRLLVLPSYQERPMQALPPHGLSARQSSGWGSIPDVQSAMISVPGTSAEFPHSLHLTHWLQPPPMAAVRCSCLLQCARERQKHKAANVSSQGDEIRRLLHRKAPHIRGEYLVGSMKKRRAAGTHSFPISLRHYLNRMKDRGTV